MFELGGPRAEPIAHLRLAMRPAGGHARSCRGRMHGGGDAITTTACSHEAHDAIAEDFTRSDTRLLH